MLKGMDQNSRYDGFGYLGHLLRTDLSDERLETAAAELKISSDDLFLWANSRSARFHMDRGLISVQSFKKALKRDLPDLKGESCH